MSNRQDEYVLGKEVTAIAKGRGAKATTVVSVRFAVDEVIRLEQISQQTGKSAGTMFGACPPPTNPIDRVACPSSGWGRAASAPAPSSTATNTFAMSTIALRPADGSEL